MKAIVETVGDFMLICPQTNQMIPFHRPAVVEVTNFFFARLGIGQLKTIADNLPDFASDKELVDAIQQEGSAQAGVELYLLTLEALAAKPEGEDLPKKIKGKKTTEPAPTPEGE